jgi:membrane protein DedA with SNARE-associated domain/membrane-associated phospholipid phosphatase
VSASQVAAALVAVVLVALAVRRRRHVGLLLVGALALAVYASGVLSSLPNAEKAIEDIAQALGPWTYALVGALAFLETGAFVGLVAPGEFTVILGGVVAGQGEINIVALIGIVWFSAALGDTTSFFLGRKLGRRFLMRHGPRLKITHERLAQVESYFQRHGGKTILIGRFIGLVRAVAPFIAGSSGIAYRRFLPYSIIGTGLWSSVFCLLGYIFYRSFSRVADIAGRATVVFGFFVGTIVAVVWIYRRLRHEEERRRLAAWLERQGERPLLRPIAAVLRPLWRRALLPAGRVVWPQLRFLWHRLTPGNLGIEFTTAIAIAAVGFYVFGAYLMVLAEDPGLTPADRELLDLARDTWTGWGLDLAKAVTNFGSTSVIVGLLVVALVLLAIARRPAELFTLGVGFLLIYATVQVTKAGIERPRPPDPQIATSNFSFPSGHAAYSTTYVAFAVIVSRVLPGVASRATLLLATLILSAAIGASRVYLHAHYWSDVAAGWGLGFGIFALCAAIALVVGHLRQTRASPRAATAIDRG